MAKALSLDLRTRVLAAVAKGASHRQAAARFGVSAASVSRWRALERAQGDALTPNRAAACRWLAPSATAASTRVRRSRQSALAMSAGLHSRQAG